MARASVNLWLSALIVLGAIAIAVGLFLLPSPPLARRAAGSPTATALPGVFGVLATGFAVLLGFVVYLAFLSYDTARSGARARVERP